MCFRTDAKNSLAYASKLYRNNKNLSDMENFSINGNEVVFGTIGDASTSEGHFWEAIMRGVPSSTNYVNMG